MCGGLFSFCFLTITVLWKRMVAITHNVWRLAEVPHSRNFGFEQELSCGILANRCYAYVAVNLG